ncbi:MAG: hypothetical protein A2Y63_01225 [Candidatus Riflebacteria bacterium RBG_13_59_9]|nr:MAG: hypothetical protein A2Y63_01225 [Candidatus Riflebacteria bacterium RBG_13_59_9]
MIKRLAAAYLEHPLKIDEKTPSFRSLVSTIMSSRTKDPVTVEATRRLFAKFRTPEEMAGAESDSIAELIYPVGFYKTKAKQLVQVARILRERFGGKVPRTREELMELPGVGRKTANLVLSVAFGIPAICVDTHVHRISNRLGWVKTKSVSETEEALMELLPESEWAVINRLLVSHGQRLCHPLSPRCSECMISHHCPRTGVNQHR